MLISWEAVSAISSTIGTVLVVIAAWIALGQLKESASTRQLQGMLGFVEQLQSSSVRGARRFIEQHRIEIGQILERPDWTEGLNAFLRAKDPAEGGPASLSELRNNLAALEFVAVLSLHGKIPSALERAHLAPTMTGYWLAVRPIVQATRAKSGDLIYLQHLEAFVGLAANGALYGRRVDEMKRREVRRLVKQGKAGVSLRFGTRSG